MALIIRVYGTTFTWPAIDELIDSLEEEEFDVTIETEDEDEEEWEELLVYESSLDEPIDVYRYTDRAEFDEEIQTFIGRLNQRRKTKEVRRLLEVLENCVIAFSVELPEEFANDDNSLLLCSLLAQLLVQKCDGFYCVDGEGFFDEAGDLVYEVASGD